MPDKTRRVTVTFEADVPVDVDNEQIAMDFEEAMRRGTGYFTGAVYNVVVKKGSVREDVKEDVKDFRELRRRREEGDIPHTSTGPDDFYHGRI